MPKIDKALEVDVAIGRALRARRVELRMSMSEVARALEWPYQQIQKYESGEIRISFSKLRQLAAILQASPDELAAGVKGFRPDFGPQIERVMDRIAAKLSKMPDAQREAAVVATLAMLEAYSKALPSAD